MDITPELCFLMSYVINSKLPFFNEIHYEINNLDFWYSADSLKALIQTPLVIDGAISELEWALEVF